MLVGHYGPAFVLKGAEKSVPLWVFFVAVQWMDVLWACFVGLGIEQFRVVPGFTATPLPCTTCRSPIPCPVLRCSRLSWVPSSRVSSVRTAGAFF